MGRCDAAPTLLTQRMAITLQEAKDWLRVDDNADDTLITGLISAAESWVQTYTNHVLNPFTMTVGDGCHEVYDFPLNVTAHSGSYEVEKRSLKSIFSVSKGSTVTISVGYATPALIPKDLITAAKKLITYMYENRDTYSAELPTDVQVLINQYRRNIAWS